ncbi:MAG: hypothetical protein HN704_10180 [Bacteroidetes bacterium]|nr:hypothetical protein [Bacteroidota bacterium]MBT6687524.1 hypothetical protein [Bacteroidota bacterium]MBT7142755.1 hypothetical protein [Bacteroidota bacterium]MBT7491958.1 hypothetical protein [Bacteroidota bacterium]
MKVEILLLFFITLFCRHAFSQITSHNIYLSDSAWYYDDCEIYGDTVNPGDTIFINASDTAYNKLKFDSFVGTAQEPIIFINKGGLVTIGTYDTYPKDVFQFSNCQHFKVLGTGDSRFKYGFRIDAARDVGLLLGSLTEEFEVSNIEICNVGFAGVQCKTELRCNEPSTHESSGNILKNMYFHDLYIHDCSGEGMYIGYVGYGGKVKECPDGDTLLYPFIAK